MKNYYVTFVKDNVEDNTFYITVSQKFNISSGKILFAKSNYKNKLVDYLYENKDFKGLALFCRDSLGLRHGKITVAI